MLWSEIRKRVLRPPGAEGVKARASVTQGTTGSGMWLVQEAGKRRWLEKNGFPALNFNSDLGTLLVELVSSAPQCLCLRTPALCPNASVPTTQLPSTFSWVPSHSPRVARPPLCSPGAPSKHPPPIL